MIHVFWNSCFSAPTALKYPVKFFSEIYTIPTACLIWKFFYLPALNLESPRVAKGFIIAVVCWFPKSWISIFKNLVFPSNFQPEKNTIEEIFDWKKHLILASNVQKSISPKPCLANFFCWTFELFFVPIHKVKFFLQVHHLMLINSTGAWTVESVCYLQQNPLSLKICKVLWILIYFNSQIHIFP